MQYKDLPDDCYFTIIDKVDSHSRTYIYRKKNGKLYRWVTIFDYPNKSEVLINHNPQETEMGSGLQPTMIIDARDVQIFLVNRLLECQI